MFARLFTFSLLLTCSTALGCGEDGPEPVGLTEVRVFTAERSLEVVGYELGCPVIEGEEQETSLSPLVLEVRQPNQGNVHVWDLFTTLPEGTCTIALQGRDDDGEVICSAEETFVVDGPLTLVEIILDCDAGSGTAP